MKFLITLCLSLVPFVSSQAYASGCPFYPEKDQKRLNKFIEDGASQLGQKSLLETFKNDKGDYFSGTNVIQIQNSDQCAFLVTYTMWDSSGGRAQAVVQQDPTTNKLSLVLFTVDKVGVGTSSTTSLNDGKALFESQ